MSRHQSVDQKYRKSGRGQERRRKEDKRRGVLENGGGSAEELRGATCRIAEAVQGHDMAAGWTEGAGFVRWGKQIVTNHPGLSTAAVSLPIPRTAHVTPPVPHNTPRLIVIQAVNHCQI